MRTTPYFIGRGPHRPGSAEALPTVDKDELRNPKAYCATPELAAAVDVALTLGMPLLLTGEPGSGKSGLAERLAFELGLGPVLHFPVKSDTESRDLFYHFDTVGRFHAAQTKDDAAKDPALYIRFQALGQAILLAKPKAFADALGLTDQALDHPGEPRRSVVLIDEIDKAPRDVPNDILVEIECMQFDIRELSRPGRAQVRIALTGEENRYRPIVVFTSNSEKALPDPFLRRCAYHHLALPPFDADLARPKERLPEDRVTVDTIVAARLGRRYRDSTAISDLVKDALAFFAYLRGDGCGLERRPTLAEFLDWLSYLVPEGSPLAPSTMLAALPRESDPRAEAQLLAAVQNLLLKKLADQGHAGQLLKDWRAQRPSRR